MNLVYIFGQNASTTCHASNAREILKETYLDISKFLTGSIPCSIICDGKYHWFRYLLSFAIVGIPGGTNQQWSTCMKPFSLSSLQKVNETIIMKTKHYFVCSFILSVSPSTRINVIPIMGFIARALESLQYYNHFDKH